MPNVSRRDRAAAALLAVWVAALCTLAGYAETADQRLAALVLVLLTAGAPALAASKKASVLQPTNVLYGVLPCGI
ncbi:hypothetical protein OHR68_35390 [Spirillospora sp. NBC_00431]